MHFPISVESCLFAHYGSQEKKVFSKLDCKNKFKELEVLLNSILYYSYDV